MTSLRVSELELKQDSLSLIDKSLDLENVQKYIARKDIDSAIDIVLESLKKVSGIVTFSEDEVSILTESIVLIAAIAYADIERCSVPDTISIIGISADQVFALNELSTRYARPDPIEGKRIVQRLCNYIFLRRGKDITNALAKRAIVGIADIVFMQRSQASAQVQ